MIPVWLKKLNCPFPSTFSEEFFDSVAQTTEGPKVSYTVSGSVWEKISQMLVYEGNRKLEISKRNYLVNQIGLLAVNQEDGKTTITLNPFVYREWYEREFGTQLGSLRYPQTSSRDTEEEQKMESMETESLSLEEETHSISSDKTDVDELSTDTGIQEGHEVGPALAQEAIKESKLPLKRKSIRTENMKEEREDQDIASIKKLKQSSRSADPTPPTKKQLTIPITRLNKLYTDYYELNDVIDSQKVDFKNALKNLLRFTQLKIRPIKPSEKKYLQTNYMVNLENRENGLENIEELVKQKGRLTVGSIDQYYDVLEDSRGSVVGHLVFYHDKDKNEVKIPAVEVALESRGRRYGEILLMQVLSFCQDNNVQIIRLETGHHERSEHLQESLTQGMRTFYCKLGFRLEGEDASLWYKKSLDEKVKSFHQEHDKCVFDFSENANSLAIGEAIKTIYVYKIKDSMNMIISDHLKLFDRYYDALDLLSCKEYTGWLVQQLSKSDLQIPIEYIEGCLKLLTYEITSKKNLTKTEKATKNMSSLLAALPQKIQEEAITNLGPPQLKDTVVANGEKSDLGTKSFFSRRRREKQSSDSNRERQRSSGLNRVNPTRK